MVIESIVVPFSITPIDIIFFLVGVIIGILVRGRQR